MVQNERVTDLIARLRKCGLSNGSSLGPHSGLCDEAADELERLQAELAEFQQAKAEWRAVIFPVSLSDKVWLIKDGSLVMCTIRTLRSRTLGGWTLRLYPLIQDWCAPRVRYYEVNLAQFNKTWFKDLDLAKKAVEEYKKEKINMPGACSVGCHAKGDNRGI